MTLKQGIESGGATRLPNWLNSGVLSLAFGVLCVSSYGYCVLFALCLGSRAEFLREANVEIVLGSMYSGGMFAVYFGIRGLYLDHGRQCSVAGLTIVFITGLVNLAIAIITLQGA
jgi:hypothetical protein